RMLLSSDELKVVKVRNNELISRYCASAASFANVSVPFIPDAIVYCKANYLYFPQDKSAEILEVAKQEITQFIEQFGYTPKVLALKNIGILAVGDDARQCELILDVFEDAIKIAQLSESFGGPSPLNDAQIRFIDTWEVENYRRTVVSRAANGRLRSRVIIVTGAAQGFGEGIAKYLISEGANIVVADLNEATGARTAGLLDKAHPAAKSLFVKTDVSDPASLDLLMQRTILEFGGVDCFISNAGVLRAGGLEEMTPETFDFVTRINYNAFFYCTRAVSRIMKLQTKFANPGYFADIIQINSKSGLRGSKANFAYAGGKFGGIGLMQSFALELAPHRIKVNAVCPGNYYEGPLWSDPENGLFVQYLNAGKVPGAKTVEDVKNFYLAQVPMHKGCTPEDVGKGVIYLMDQTGETGQALPVTGGQVMLS
ncbi:MAG: SDR family NAD(P)-dependent oxidoreductase, partial [Rhodanobacter sp.]